MTLLEEEAVMPYPLPTCTCDAPTQASPARASAPAAVWGGPVALAAAVALVCCCGTDELLGQLVQLTIAVLLTALLIAAALGDDDGDESPVEAVDVAVGVGSGGRR